MNKSILSIIAIIAQFNLIFGQSCFSPEMVEECINTIRFNIQKCLPNDYSCMCNLSRGFPSCLGTGPHCQSESNSLNLVRMTESESQGYCTANSQLLLQNAAVAGGGGGAVTIGEANNPGPTPVYPILANIPLATDPSNLNSLPPNILNRNSITRLPFPNSDFNLKINFVSLISVIIMGSVASFI
ncbi:hypothetical protein CONCODRAFT_71208 [Conidiobolus coronatus NRRL 28638]|uniref:Extracellular membrane protein CFEM domain-containing protein n=1 Tax=Conidiobolus coronatus (strain ATCC 28846 / CBS 209.66 / NRRL 28638) TaxID=796925 RepID=A0A137P4B5_CONC2|nr:hypothetical protein CONCODRAFT_71208 [Conidiobolus coronatus NRRL 28638]|eukprot:KXN69754.1 hypothetical protein CONCODRAFT_71208 [Conidiobolus coronatus NRRL 28638]